MAAAAMTACWTGTSGESRRNISTSGAWSMNCSRRAALNLMWRGRGFRACKITCSGSLPQVSAVQDVKASLLLAVQGINRGIFGVPTPKKNEIEELLKTLESLNPSPKPTENLDKVKISGYDRSGFYVRQLDNEICSLDHPFPNVKEFGE